MPLLNILKKSLDIKLFKRPKEGFNPDLEELIETIGLDTIFEILVNEKNLSFIRKDFIQNIINEHKSGKVNHSYRIYQLLYFNFWIDCNYK
jgi:asparagine synthase (glutamine-hydrolysing)